MQTNNLPERDPSTDQLQAKIQAVSSQADSLLEVFNSQITKATILITAQKDGAAINRVFMYDKKTGIPQTLYNFFETEGSNLLAQKLRLESDNCFLLVKNAIVPQSLFLLDYTAGDPPLLSKEDAYRIKNLSIGSKCLVTLGAEPQEIQKIS